MRGEFLIPTECVTPITSQYQKMCVNLKAICWPALGTDMRSASGQATGRGAVMRNSAHRIINASQPGFWALYATALAIALIISSRAAFDGVTSNIYNAANRYWLFEECKRDMPGYEVDILMYVAIFLVVFILQKLLSDTARRNEALIGGLMRRLSPWRSIKFRYLAYGLAVYGGKMWRWLSSSWRPHLFWVVVFAALGVAHQKLLPAGGSPGASGEKVTFLNVARQSLSSLPFLTKVLVSYAFAWVVFSYWRGRNRLLILAPVNHAGEAFKDFADGLELQIMNSLKRLADLLSTPDRGVDPSRNGGLEAPKGSKISAVRINVDDDIARFANLIDDSAAVSLGPAKVSLKALFNLVARLTRGNQLRSSLHRNGDKLLLVAELARGGSWKIECEIADDTSKEDRAERLDQMYHELVYSVLRSLPRQLPRQTGLSWKPLRHVSVGLRALLDAQSNQVGRFDNLRKAEEHFLAARGLADGVARFSYLLGVVYVELEKYSDPNEASNWNAAARAAFTQALREDPRHLDAAYAIAWQSCSRAGQDDTDQHTDQYAFAVEFADRMLAVDRTDARAWNIRGVALRGLREGHGKEDAWKGGLDNSESAAQYLWSAICKQAWLGKVPASLRQDQTDYFTNLGLAVRKPGSCKRAKRILRQAMHDNPASRPAFALAMILDEKLGDQVEWVQKHGGKVDPYFGTYRSDGYALLGWMRARWYWLYYRKPPAEMMFKKAIFASKKLEERAQIRVWLAVSLLKWRKNVSYLGVNTLHYNDKIQEALSQLLDSPSLIKGEEMKLLSDCLDDRMFDFSDCVPQSLYIYGSSAHGGKRTLWTTFYLRSELNQLPCGDLDSQYCNGDKLAKLTSVIAELRRHSPTKYAPADRGRNAFEWLRAYTLIMLGAIRINDPTYFSRGGKDVKDTLKKGIADLNSGISILDQPGGFPREDILIAAYAKLSWGQSRMMQLEIDPRDRGNDLSGAVKNADKQKARSPFDASGYWSLQWMYAVRSDFESAERTGVIGESLNPIYDNFLYSRAWIHWKIGKEKTDPKLRNKYFRSAIGALESYLLRITDICWQGHIHFWLGRFFGELGEYDRSRNHYEVARNLNYNIIASSMFIVINYVRQEQYDLARSYLNDAMYQLAESRRRYMKENSNGAESIPALKRKWLGERDEGAFSFRDQFPIGFLLSRIILLKAVVRCERHHYSGAQRHLDSASQFIERWPLKTKASREEIFERRALRRSLDANRLDVRGRIQLGRGDRNEAIRAFQESLVIEGTAGTAYQLARLAVARAEDSKPGRPRRTCIDEAGQKIDQTRKLDIQDLYVERLAKLEQRLEKLSVAPTNSRPAA